VGGAPNAGVVCVLNVTFLLSAVTSSAFKVPPVFIFPLVSIITPLTEKSPSGVSSNDPLPLSALIDPSALASKVHLGVVMLAPPSGFNVTEPSALAVVASPVF
jgi:hypothetical protein